MNITKSSWSTLATLALLFAPLSAQAALPGWGAEARTVIMSYCPSYCSSEGPMYFSGQGGEGSLSASDSQNNYAGIVQSQATLNGASYTPLLKASAYSNPGTGAVANAYAVQGFTFAGAASQSFSLAINLHGSTSGEGSVYSHVAVILGDNLPYYPDFSTLMSEIVAYDPGLKELASAFLSITDPFNTTATGTLDFTLNPGDNFYVWADLKTSGYRGGYGDAFNTLTMSFDNDTNLQAASVAAAVPEPAELALMLSGLLVLGLKFRRKNV